MDETKGFRKSGKTSKSRGANILNVRHNSIIHGYTIYHEAKLIIIFISVIVLLNKHRTIDRKRFTSIIHV